MRLGLWEVGLSLSWISKNYRVPAKVGQRVRYTGDKGPKCWVREGTIVGAHGAHLKIRMDGDSFSGHYHPTWELEYLLDPTVAQIKLAGLDPEQPGSAAP